MSEGRVEPGEVGVVVGLLRTPLLARAWWVAIDAFESAVGTGRRFSGSLLIYSIGEDGGDGTKPGGAWWSTSRRP